MKKHVIRINTPPDIAQSTNSEGPWVEFNTRVVNKYHDVFVELATKGALMAGIDKKKLKNPAYQEKAMILASQFGEVYERQYDAIAAFVSDWNWQGPSGLPLPKPDKAEIFKNELYEDQTQWLIGQINILRQYRATEGNALSSTP